MVTYRLARGKDVAELAAMRWEFRLEGVSDSPKHDRQEFMSACQGFLQQGLDNGRWTYWIAEAAGQIVAHVFIQRIEKVPKPNRLEDAFGYVTNVYTRPAFRNQGIGTQLLNRVIDWAHDQDLELLLVWPGKESIEFYERSGFTRSDEILIYELRPYIA
jgi:GNAT superfamily N-acetyltransferase